MECEQMEKVSQLVDGELSDDEAATIRNHIADCQICERACAEFNSLRLEIRAFDIRLDPFEKQRVLRKLVTSQNPSLWRRRIAIPVPAMAFALLALIAIALSWTVRLSRMSSGQEARVKRITAESQPQGAFDLSRFDHGDRAAIVKIKQGPGSANQ